MPSPFGPIPNSPCPNGGFPAQAVPTSVVLGPDGAYYVGLLGGFPFAPGTSPVYRIDPALGSAALCSGLPAVPSWGSPGTAGDAAASARPHATGHRSCQVLSGEPRLALRVSRPPNASLPGVPAGAVQRLES
jgi:hypothetical protein